MALSWGCCSLIYIIKRPCHLPCREWDAIEQGQKPGDSATTAQIRWETIAGARVVSGGGEKWDRFRMYFGEFLRPTGELDVRSEGKQRSQEWRLGISSFPIHNELASPDHSPFRRHLGSVHSSPCPLPPSVVPGTTSFSQLDSCSSFLTGPES